jgi:hypothetical protein
MTEAFRGKEKQWAEVIALTWRDADFRRKLFGDPIPVLKERGIEFPAGVRVGIVQGCEYIRGITVEGTTNEITVTIPPPAELGSSLLQAVCGTGHTG